MRSAEQKKALYFFQSKVPELLIWIEAQLEKYAASSKPVSSLGPTLLDSFFSQNLLNHTRFVVTPVLPMPPLEAMGLGNFLELNPQSLKAITYRNTYFILPEYQTHVQVHCHELIHVLQWKYLGPEQFLLAYGIELLGCGYEYNYFEIMARKYETQLEASDVRQDTEKAVINELETYF